MNRIVVSCSACLAWLLSGCSPTGDDIPGNLPKQVKGNWGAEGRACPRLDGDYQFMASDGRGFLPAGDEMFTPDFGQWSAVRLESRSPVDYAITRTMTRDDFLAAALQLRAAAPDRYLHWRADTLTTAGKQRRDRPYVNPADRLKPWLMQEQRGSIVIRGCNAGWVTLMQTNRFVKNAEGLDASEYIKVDVTPDVERGLLVRTTQCRYKSAQVLSIEYCSGSTTSYARMAPTAWPDRWIVNAGDLPLPATASDATRTERVAVQQPGAPEPSPPPSEMSRLASGILERIVDRLPAGASLGSITAMPDSVVVVLRSPVPDHVREVTAMLLADAAVGDVRSTSTGTNPPEYKLIVKPR